MIEVIDNVLCDNFNRYLMESVLYQDAFRPVFSEQTVNGDVDVTDQYSDGGFVLTSYRDPNRYEDRKEKNLRFQELNHLAEIVLYNTLKESKQIFSNIRLERIIWNYYNRSSICMTHQDRPPNGYGEGEEYVSIVYYPNTCDGGTKIGEKIVESVSGRACMFDSSIFHSSLPIIKSKYRVVLNLMLQVERG